MYVYMYESLYIYIYMYVCVHVCVSELNPLLVIHRKRQEKLYQDFVMFFNKEIAHVFTTAGLRVC
jgi:hypothetical protein